MNHYGSAPNICASPRAGAIVAWSTDQPVRGGPQRRAEPSGTYRGWFVWLARDHERSGSQRGAQRGHGNRLPAVLMDDPLMARWRQELPWVRIDKEYFVRVNPGVLQQRRAQLRPWCR